MLLCGNDRFWEVTFLVGEKLVYKELKTIACLLFYYWLNLSTQYNTLENHIGCFGF